MIKSHQSNSRTKNVFQSWIKGLIFSIGLLIFCLQFCIRFNFDFVLRRFAHFQWVQPFGSNQSKPSSSNGSTELVDGIACQQQWNAKRSCNCFQPVNGARAATDGNELVEGIFGIS